MPDAILLLSLAELGARYRDGTLTPVEVTERHLDRIAKVEPVLDAFQIIDAPGARQAAREATSRWQAGMPLGPIDGAPITIKDNMDVAGHPTRHGSTVTPTTPATADAPVVARLREAGAVILGKTTLPEFGWKGITDSGLRGATRNAWDVRRSPGGSSGGAAASLAAGIGAFAFGNDGGGSIRIPASLSGVFGIKPNLGRVPHLGEGLFATLVAGGPLTRSVADAATALSVMAGPDARDWHGLPPPSPGWLDNLAPRLSGLRLAWAPGLAGAVPDDEILAVTEAAISAMRNAGAEIVDVGSVIDDPQPEFEAFWRAGFASRLRSIPPDRWDEIDPGFRQIAEQGLEIGVAPVLAAEAARAAMHRHFTDLFRDHDLLLTPTTPHAAPLLDVIYHTQFYDRWRDGVPYTLPFNLTGHPAASIPCGVTPAGLPVGLQVVGPKYAERAILEACLAIEALIDFAPLARATAAKLVSCP